MVKKEYSTANIKKEVRNFLKPLMIKNLEIFCPRPILNLNKFEWSGSFTYESKTIELKLNKFLSSEINEKRIAWQIARYIAINKLHLSPNDSQISNLYKYIPEGRRM